VDREFLNDRSPPFVELLEFFVLCGIFSSDEEEDRDDEDCDDDEDADDDDDDRGEDDEDEEDEVCRFLNSGFTGSIWPALTKAKPGQSLL